VQYEGEGSTQVEKWLVYIDTSKWDLTTENKKRMMQYMRVAMRRE